MGAVGAVDDRVLQHQFVARGLVAFVTRVLQAEAAEFGAKAAVDHAVPFLHQQRTSLSGDPKPEPPKAPKLPPPNAVISITPGQIRHYADVGGDHNPIHVDTDFAHSAGMPDVIAHGMLSMGWLARLLTNWVPQTAIRDYSVRFAAITQVGERITCAGKVVEKLERHGERCVRVALSTANQDGVVKLAGEALIALE